QAEEFDILHHHHLVILDFVEGSIDDLVNVGAVSSGKKLQRLLDSLGRALKPVAVGILSEDLQHLLDVGCNGAFFPTLSQYLHYRLIRFHQLALQRCSAGVPRCGSFPISATLRGTRYAIPVSGGGRSQRPGSPTSEPLARRARPPRSDCDVGTVRRPSAQ